MENFIDILIFSAIVVSSIDTLIVYYQFDEKMHEDLVPGYKEMKEFRRNVKKWRNGSFYYDADP